MRTLIAINMPKWKNSRIISGRQHQAQCNELAAAIRMFADKVQHCGIEAGDVTFERDGLSASMRCEGTAAPAAAA